MNCTVALKLLQLYLDNALHEVEARAVEHHVAQCGACRSEFLRLERAILAVEQLPRMAAPPGLYARTMTKVWEQQRAREEMPIRRWVARTAMALVTVMGLVFGLQSALVLVLGLPEVALDSPLAAMESLLFLATSVELSQVVGSGLLFLAGSAALLQLVVRNQPPRPA